MKRSEKDILREAEQRALERRTDAEGRAIIPMTVRDDSDFLSPFSEGSMPLISADVAEYLEEKTEELPRGKELVLQIRSGCIDPAEQEAYRLGVKEFYLIRYLSVRRELRRNLLLALILAAAGMLALLLAHLIDAHLGAPYWMEMTDIVAWVFVWEAVDTLVFGSHEFRTQKRRCLAFMDMKIEFYPPAVSEEPFTQTAGPHRDFLEGSE